MFRAGERQSPEALERASSPTCRRRWRSTRRGSRPRGACSASTPRAPGPARRTSTSLGSSARSCTATRSARPGRSSRPTSSAAVVPAPARPRSSARGRASIGMLMKAPVQIGRLQRFACDVAAAAGRPVLRAGPADGQARGRDRLGTGRAELRPRAAPARARRGRLRGARPARAASTRWASPPTRSRPSSLWPRSR